MQRGPIRRFLLDRFMDRTYYGERRMQKGDPYVLDRAIERAQRKGRQLPEDLD